MRTIILSVVLLLIASSAQAIPIQFNYSQDSWGISIRVQGYSSDPIAVLINDVQVKSTPAGRMDFWMYEIPMDQLPAYLFNPGDNILTVTFTGGAFVRHFPIQTGHTFFRIPDGGSTSVMILFAMVCIAAAHRMRAFSGRYSN